MMRISTIKKLNISVKSDKYVLSVKLSAKIDKDNQLEDEFTIELDHLDNKSLSLVLGEILLRATTLDEMAKEARAFVDTLRMELSKQFRFE